MLGPFATTSRLTPIHKMSLAVLSWAACASMSTTTTTTTTRDRGDRYGPMEWAQQTGSECDPTRLPPYTIRIPHYDPGRRHYARAYFHFLFHYVIAIH